ncbi:MAG TPA: hypothetical protein VKN76_17295 [Kiloniellaceae bacterium]|nr:hypothetical protein [Kiloniellaceae bacterium]
MNESDEFRQQVEELKQRLGATQAQHESQSTALTQRLASIKASLQQKQEEIVRLSAENQQLRIMLDEVIALLNQREDMSSGQMIDGFLEEIAEFIDSEKAQMVPDITISVPPAPSAWEREEKPVEIEEPAKIGAGDEIEAAANFPVEPSASDEMKAEPEPVVQDSTPTPMQLQAKEPDSDSEKDQPQEEEEQEEVPALKRILKRGQRGR